MQKDLTQEWLDWIFENIQVGCDKNELLKTLIEEGFNQTQCKIALGLDLSGEELVKEKKFKRLKINIYQITKYLLSISLVYRLKSMKLQIFFPRKNVIF